MPTIRIDLDAESFRRLSELAVAERRPIPWQAEVLLIRALGFPFPIAHESEPCVPTPAQPQEGTNETQGQ